MHLVSLASRFLPSVLGAINPPKEYNLMPLQFKPSIISTHRASWKLISLLLWHPVAARLIREARPDTASSINRHATHPTTASQAAFHFHDHAHFCDASPATTGKYKHDFRLQMKTVVRKKELALSSAPVDRLGSS